MNSKDRLCERNEHLDEHTQVSPVTDLLEIDGQVVDEPVVITDKLDIAVADPSESADGSRDVYHNEILETTGEVLPLEGPSTGPSRLKSAYQNTKHFAGGLISHPFEATKHFSILRHSHGLVFYQGPFTSIAITIFSDQPLPADRTLWLQSKGWTGKTGLRIKALARANASWIDVTPSETLGPQQTLPSDNRAWERDINKFLKKVPRQLQSHKPRETAVLRIPHEAEDGYFRIILCGNRSMKSLCPSPVFRIASTGLSSAKFKGASLSTLPAEIGAKILSSTASNAAYNLLSPIAQRAEDAVGQYMPGALTQEVGTTAYTATGAEDRVGAANEQYQSAREAAFEHLEEERPELGRLNPLGSKDGLESPYPLRFSAKVVKGRGEDTKDTGAPSANLGGVPEEIRAKLTGVYFGWALLSVQSKERSHCLDILDGWKEALINVAPSVKTTPTVAPNKEVTIHLLQGFGKVTFFGAKMSVMVLGYMHPFRPCEPETSSMELYRDITVAQLSLARPAWTPDNLLEQIQLAKKGRSLTEHYVNARQYVQKQADKIPLHRLGIKTDSMGVRDKWIGQGGFSIPR